MRIRTIKPEFWTDATMVQMEPLARLLFVGLWNVADDHGYLPDEPDRLAMLVLPKEAPERVQEMLDLLEAADRIERIEDDDGAVLRIKNWERHQRVDKPSASKLARDGRKVKIPDAVRRAVATKYGCKPGREVEAKCYHCGSVGAVHWWKLASGAPSAWVTFTGLQLDHLEAESNGGATTESNIVLACRACNAGKKNNHAFSLMLAKILEGSGNPRESSPLEGKGKEREREVEQGKGTGIVPQAALGPTPEDLAHLWNTTTTPPLPKVDPEKLGKSRREAFTAALKRRGLPEWKRVFELANASSYCRGSKDWVADIDWATRAEGKKPEPARKLLEGSFADPPNGSAARAQDWKRERASVNENRGPVGKVDLRALMETDHHVS